MGFRWNDFKLIFLTVLGCSLFSSPFANSEELGVVDLTSHQDILKEFKECRLNLQFDVHRSSIVSFSGYQVHINKNNVQLKDDYAIIKTKGRFHGFMISALRVPTSKGPKVWEQYTVTLNGKVSDVLTTLEKDWHVKFEFRGADDGPDDGDGPQITYATSVKRNTNNVVSRLFLQSYSNQEQRTILQCDFLDNRGD